MKKILHGHIQDFVIMEFAQIRHEDKFRKFNDKSSALNFLYQFIHDTFNMMSLRRILAERLSHIDLSRLNNHQVCEQVAWQLVSGHIRILPVAASSFVTQGTSTGQVAQTVEEIVSEEEMVSSSATATTIQELNWIKFQVLDDETGLPVQNVTFMIKLPDGTVGEFTTDANGMVHINDLPAGELEIEKMLDSDALEVLNIE